MGGAAPTLTVVVPAWNEAEGLDETVAALRAILLELVEEQTLTDYELIVVDDGSTDATPDLIDEHAHRDPRVRALRHTANRGLGAAIRTGLEAATGQLVLYTDADLPADPSCIRTALSHVSGDQVLVCAHRSRRRADGPRRLLYSAGYNALVRLVLGVRVRDVNFAFKLGPTDRLRVLGLCSEGSFIDAELVARARRAGLRTAQFEVDYQPRRSGRSTLSSVPVIIDILREMIRWHADIRKGPSCASP